MSDYRQFKWMAAKYIMVLSIKPTVIDHSKAGARPALEPECSRPAQEYLPTLLC